MAKSDEFQGKMYSVHFQGGQAKFGWEWDAKRTIGVLRVEFANGSIYEYFDVPKLLWADFWGAKSKGKWFVANIKNNKSISFEKQEL